MKNKNKQKLINLQTVCNSYYLRSKVPDANSSFVDYQALEAQCMGIHSYVLVHHGRQVSTGLLSFSIPERPSIITAWTGLLD